MARRDPVALLTLREVRHFIARSGARPAVAFFALLYLLGAMSWGGMLDLTRTSYPYTVTLLLGTPLGTQSWNYPGLLITAPWGVVVLPFFATVTMVASAVGVGFGMTVAFLLVARLIVPKAAGARQSGAVGGITGLTPAMISLVTLGACCSTTGVATAGVGIVATATGTSVTALLLNNWYLGVFQVALVWVSLVAQEVLLVVYGSLFGLEPLPGSARAPPRYDRRFALGALLRVALFVGGFLWIMAIFADWTTGDFAGAGPGLWFRWLFQHGLLGAIAVAAALFPVGTAETFARIREGTGRLPVAVVLAGGIVGTLAALVWLAGGNPYVTVAATVFAVTVISFVTSVWARDGAGYVLAGFALVAGLATVLWVPAALAAAGVDALVNQVLGAVGAPAAWGAVGSASLANPAVYVRWLLEYLLVGGFAIAAVLAPRRTFAPILASVGRPLTVSAEAGSPAPRRPSDGGTGATSVPRGL